LFFSNDVLCWYLFATVLMENNSLSNNFIFPIWTIVLGKGSNGPKRMNCLCVKLGKLIHFVSSNMHQMTKHIFRNIFWFGKSSLHINFHGAEHPLNLLSAQWKFQRSFLCLDLLFFLIMHLSSQLYIAQFFFIVSCNFCKLNPNLTYAMCTKNTSVRWRFITDI
jgi:hypothetical protein